LLVGAALVFYQYWLSEEAEIRRGLLAITDAVRLEASDLPGRRDRRIQEMFHERLTDDVVVRAQDLPVLTDARHTLLTWTRLLRKYDSADTELSTLDISRSGDVADVRAEVSLRAQKDGYVLSEARHVRLRLVHKSEHWQVQSVDVSIRPKDYPEARP
jgi:hypothetical protein